jgi:spore maturation protein CgeB
VPRIVIVDTYYQDFLKTVRIDPESRYEFELAKLLGYCFGTGDFYSRNLRALGWDAIDIITNCEPLQRLWAEENGVKWSHPMEVLESQIDALRPDVIFSQDLSINFRCQRPRVMAGQCSCPMPRTDFVKDYNVVFTSFPHYGPILDGMGVRPVLNPLAFDPIVLGLIEPVHDRPYDVTFVGGVGAPSHWKKGMETLEAVAEAIPTAAFWGYGYSTLPHTSAVRQKYRGYAWGLDMYRILRGSKIVINRHGEVAQGFANNMRMYEATGCGAALLTEEAPNLAFLFEPGSVATYRTTDEVIGQIRHLLDNPDDLSRIARYGQQQTLTKHTYAKQMQTVSDTLRAML